MIVACFFCGAVRDNASPGFSPQPCCVYPVYVVPEVVEDPQLLKKVRGAMHLSPKDKRLYHSCAVCGKIWDVTAEASRRRRLESRVIITCTVCENCHSHVLAGSSWGNLVDSGSVALLRSFKEVVSAIPKKEFFREADIIGLRRDLRKLSVWEENHGG